MYWNLYSVWYTYVQCGSSCPAIICLHCICIEFGIWANVLENLEEGVAPLLYQRTLPFTAASEYDEEEN